MRRFLQKFTMFSIGGCLAIAFCLGTGAQGSIGPTGLLIALVIAVLTSLVGE